MNNKKIKFGTDGWRAIIADEYTADNVMRVAQATALWLKKNEANKPAVIGHDCRFGGKMFSELTARVLAANGISCILSETFVSTPMVSLCTKRLNAGIGIVITASHNPPEYNGFKLKGKFGGPALPEQVAEVENLIADEVPEMPGLLQEYIDAGLVSYYDMESEYVNHAENSFDMTAIRNSRIRIGYDAMYGAGQNAVRRLLPDAFYMHADFNPSFKGQAPEPILKNLQEISRHIAQNKDIDFCFATDGDADRIGVLNSRGEFVDSHHIILMLIQYLHGLKGLNGEIVNSFSCTGKITQLASQLGLKQVITKIGFKYICGYMVDGDVMIGGEESGGIAVANHIPERDGVWIALTLLEYMAKSGKSLDDLINAVYEAVGPFAMERYDLQLLPDLKDAIVGKLKAEGYDSFGPYKVERIETTDGYKMHLGNGEWVMIRASGTEPVLRVYAESHSSEEAFAILDAAKATLLAPAVEQLS